MPTSVPLHAQLIFGAERIADENILLLEIYDPQSYHLFYTSYPAVRLSLDPLTFGVISNDIPYYFRDMSYQVPTEQEGTPPNTTIELLDTTIETRERMKQLSEQTQVIMTYVIASVPDVPVKTFPMFSLVNVTATQQRIALTLSGERATLGGGSLPDPWPAGNQTRDQQPGLFR